MEIIIVEDEKPAARYLQRKIEALGYKVKQQLHSVSEAVIWFKSNPAPDLVFLDIQLSDGLSFEIFEKVNLNCSLIFTTAYDDYALKAFKLNSVDYLLKPIDPEELAFAISKFKNYKESSNVSFNSIKLLMDVVTKQINFKERFLIKIGLQIKIIEIKDIICFFSENKSTYIKTIDNRDFLVDFSLDSVEVELNPNLFYRINRKFILNRDFINEISIYSNSRLKIVLKAFSSNELIVSREKVVDFKKWIL